MSGFESIDVSFCSLKQRIRVRIYRRIQQSCVLHAVLVLQHCIRSLLLRKQYERRSHTKQLLRQTSKHTLQVKAKQTQSNRGGNRRPPPIPFETSIGSNDSDRKFLQHPFRHRGMQPPKRKKTRRGKRKTPRCRTGRRHTPNAPDPTLDRGGFRGVYLTLLTSQSSVPTLTRNPPNHRVCL